MIGRQAGFDAVPNGCSLWSLMVPRSCEWVMCKNSREFCGRDLCFCVQSYILRAPIPYGYRYLDQPRIYRTKSCERILKFCGCNAQTHNATANGTRRECEENANAHARCVVRCTTETLGMQFHSWYLHGGCAGRPSPPFSFAPASGAAGLNAGVNAGFKL